MQASTLRRVVDEHVASEDRRRPSAADAEARPLPERLPRFVDDPGRVEDIADAHVTEPARKPERDDRLRRDAVRDAHADPNRAQPEPPGHALLRARRARERQPVSVHTMLRTVSFRLLDASYAADGSKPQWMPQCSQRGSFPGP